jgi:hypothetical protein
VLTPSRRLLCSSGFTGEQTSTGPNPDNRIHKSRSG